MLNFKQYTESVSTSNLFGDIEGKLESRKYEFRAIAPILSKFGNVIKILSLPGEYKFEKDLLAANPEKVVHCYGVDYNPKLNLQYAVAAQKNPNLVTFIPKLKTDINDVIVSPDITSFYHPKEVNGVIRFDKDERTGKSKVYKLPNDLDIIDLDYTGIPLSPKMTRTSNTNSFIYVVKAARLLKSGGLIAATFSLDVRGKNMLTVAKTRMPEYYELLKNQLPGADDYFDVNNPPPEHLKANNLKSSNNITPIERYKTNAKISNEYINQIVTTSLDPEYSTGLKLVFANMYKGKKNNNVMWRGVFQK